MNTKDKSSLFRFFRRSFMLLPTAGSLLAGGCFTVSPRTGAPAKLPVPAPVKTAAPVAPAREEPATFQRAIEAALHRQLDIRITESLQNFAAEHARNDRTLAVAVALYRDEGAAASASLMAKRREALEHAIGFAHLLGSGAGNLAEVRRPRESQLLSRQTAAALVRWQIRHELPLTRKRECEMETRLLTGWDTSRLNALKGPFPPSPYPFPADLETLQQFAVYNRPECGHLRIHHELAGALRQNGDSRLRTEERLIHLLYRLPLQSDARDTAQQKVIAAAIGAAVAMQIDEDLRRLNAAYERFRMAELRAELQPSSALMQQARLAAADWQTAYIDLLTDLGSTEYMVKLPPVKPFEAPELTAESARLLELLAEEEEK